MTQSAKEKFVKEKCSPKGFHYVKDNRTRKNGSVYILYKSRPVGSNNYISSKTYNGLINKLYDFYTGAVDISVLGDVFEDATRWKAQRYVTVKTIYEYKRIWDKYLANSSVGKMKFSQIDPVELTECLEQLCITHSLTWQQVQNIRNVLSYILEYCVRKRLIKLNPLSSVDFNCLPTVKTTSMRGSIKKTPFTPEQTELINKWCDNEIKNNHGNILHYLGIKFSIVMGARYGELRGLKWDDIDFAGRTITIHDMSVPCYKLEDDLSFKYCGRQLAGHIKGYEKPVSLPMPDIVQDTLLAIKRLRLDNEFVFPTLNFRYNTFNDKIKLAAGAIGLVPSKYSTHSLRATAATNLYLKTNDIYQVQMLLHHTTPEMTMKYIKDLDISERLRTSMMTAFQKSSVEKVVTSGDQNLLAENAALKTLLALYQCAPLTSEKPLN